MSLTTLLELEKKLFACRVAGAVDDTLVVVVANNQSGDFELDLMETEVIRENAVAMMELTIKIYTDL